MLLMKEERYTRQLKWVIFGADTLTSQPINLAFSPDSNIVLSFFYQPQGKGNQPEHKDSLVLYFRSPVDNIWKKQWKAFGEATKPFEQVLIPINDTLFLRNGFQFRFVNYASLDIVDESLGFNANADHWNIDYVRLDKNRTLTDTVINDICFVYPIQSLVLGFETIPWEHYHRAAITEHPRLYLKYVNRDTIIRKATSRFRVEDMLGNTPVQDFQVWSSNLTTDVQLDAYFKTGSINFNTNDSTAGLFKVTGYLQIDEDFDNHLNDTTIYYQRFEDYYAYDDGTSENGYGVTAKGAAIAYQFKPYASGALKAIDISFNHNKDTSYTQSKYFYLTIWDDNNGEPGDTLYQQIGTRPEYTHMLNGFHRYVLTRDVLVSNTFYIGLVQTTDDMLNIGFDANRNAKDKLFYNISGQWKNSKFNKALMMRPVFGNPEPSAYLKKEKIPITINPIPSNNFINITINNQLVDKTSSIIIYDSRGIIVKNLTCNGTINVSNMPRGIYFIRILQQDGRAGTGKFIVIK